MTEITRVPLQPIAKGSLAKLWIAVAALILLGAGLAWAAIPGGVKVETLVEGSGPTPDTTDVAFVRYVGRLPDGTVFDESQEIPLPVEGIFPEGNPLPLDRMVPGFTEGAVQMQKGGKYRLTIPAKLGYGAEGRQDQMGNDVIPPNSDLVFEVEMVEFMSAEDFQQRLATLQQALQMQQSMGGAEGGATAPAPGAGPAPGAENGGAEGGVVRPPAPVQ